MSDNDQVTAVGAGVTLQKAIKLSRASILIMGCYIICNYLIFFFSVQVVLVRLCVVLLLVAGTALFSALLAVREVPRSSPGAVLMKMFGTLAALPLSRLSRGSSRSKKKLLTFPGLEQKHFYLGG